MKEEIYAFLDFEFNCPEQKGYNNREIISMAAVFRYSDGSPLTSFYNVVKPSRCQRISSRTIQLTGITQKQINKSRRFDKVAEDFLMLVENLSPSKFFVWGNADSTEVQKAVKYSRANPQMHEISSRFHDLQVDVMEKLGLSNPYNLERAADIYGIEFRHTFSAIEDAECLADVYFAYKNNSYDEQKLNTYKKFYEYRSIVGKYKLVQNNIRTSENKIACLRENLRRLVSGSEEYNKIRLKIDETSEYIKEQYRISEELLPVKIEAESFLDQCGLI